MNLDQLQLTPVVRGDLVLENGTRLNDRRLHVAGAFVYAEVAHGTETTVNAYPESAITAVMNIRPDGDPGGWVIGVN